MKITASHHVLGGAAVLLVTTLLTAGAAWSQVKPSDFNFNSRPTVTQDTFMGQVPKNLPPPSPDPRDLNGTYAVDLAGGGALRATPPNPGPRPSPTAAQRPPQGAFMSNCAPDAQVGHSPYAGQIVQTPGRITFIAEDNHVIRRVYLNGHFPNPIVPTYEGTSIGHWDGDTLVIETRGLKTASMARNPDFASITDVTEHVRKMDRGWKIAYHATIHGLDHDGKPITTTLNAGSVWRPDLHLMEFICEQGAGAFLSTSESHQ